MKSALRRPSSALCSLLFAPVLLLQCLFLAGCPTPGGDIRLDPAGPSRGDTVAYNAKLVLVTNHALLKSFTDWERDNAALLTNLPDVHNLAVKVRTEGPRWFQEADAKLAAYETIAQAATGDATAIHRARAALLAALALINREVNAATAAQLSIAAAPVTP